MKIVEVEWDDPCTVLEGWHHVKDINTKDFKPALCRSVGYVFKENKDYLVLVASQGSEKDRKKIIGDGLYLPKPIIKSIKEISKG